MADLFSRSYRAKIVSILLEMSSSCFVYGTLKPGERNYHVAQRGGTFSEEEGFIDGFQLFHLHPENYPAILPGDGRVQGYLLTYKDMDTAMPFLDELEGTHFDPPLYERVVTTVQPHGVPAYVYIYCDKSRCSLPTATVVESGVWKPVTSEEGLYP